MADSDDSRWTGDRRQQKADRRAQERRSGIERRGEDRGRPEGDRRSGVDRRQEDRRSGGDRRTESGWFPVPLDGPPVGINSDAVLVAAAVDARTRARAQFSGFKVGAALETSAGDIVTGCNVENATYGLTMCAERVALYKALSEGRDAFTRIAVVADTADPTPPCGPCRQLLWEFCGDVPVILANLDGIKARHQMRELLPYPFDGRLLGG